MLNDFKAMVRPIAKRSAITTGLEVAGLLSQAGVMGNARGRGVIFTLHHVRPQPSHAFQPNALLEITPEFLDTAISTLRDDGYRFIALEDVASALESDDRTPFAVFTLDDGYRDNASDAAPVFSKHRVPFTIFLAKGLTNATHSMWWETAERLIRQETEIKIRIDGDIVTLPSATPAEKMAAFEGIARYIHAVDEAVAVASLDQAARNAGLDPREPTRELVMRDQEIDALANNPLARFGAHTISHRSLGRLSEAESQFEIEESVAAVSEIIGTRPTTFAYPYGNARAYSRREMRLLASAGITTAVTTRPGVLRDEDTSEKMLALPRVSLNGLYQKARYVRALASGIPFKLMGA